MSVFNWKANLVACLALLISLNSFALSVLPTKAKDAAKPPVAVAAAAAKPKAAAAAVTPVYIIPPIPQAAAFQRQLPQNNSLAPMLQKVLPAVVNVRADIKITDLSVLFELEKQHNLNIDRGSLPDTILSVGSGVIVDAAKGYIITNAHVVNDAQTITVTLDDGRHYTAKLIGLDKASDVALLQIQAKNLVAIPIVNSSILKVGDPVAAIGNPYGLNQTVTSGIISALGRASLGIENIENFIQTDAPINPGNSGGALLNIRGELVGINTAILAPDRGSIGIGFAVPSDIVWSVMQQLIKFGDVKRGVLGIGVQDITPSLSDALHLKGKNSTEGALVTLTQLNSPAQKSGIIEGDIIKAVNNTPIKNANDVVATVGFLRVDSKVNLAIDRNNNRIMISTVLTDAKKLKDSASDIDPFFYGVGMQNFYLLSPLHGEIKGIMIVSVDQSSHAWQADLRPGDVIVSVDNKKVETITDMQAVASHDKPTIVLNVLRGGGAQYLVVNKEDY
jgi:serine protease Do